MSVIKAPWSDEQVRLLSLQQQDPRRHPYTCPEHSSDPLEATPSGWRCRRCEYAQNWAHDPNREMQVWTIYDHPSDFPDKFVARRWVDARPTKDVLICSDLDELRQHFERMGLMLILRNADDDPVIVESWV